MMHHIADKAEHIYIALGSTDFRKQQNGLDPLISLKVQLESIEIIDSNGNKIEDKISDRLSVNVNVNVKSKNGYKLISEKGNEIKYNLKYGTSISSEDADVYMEAGNLGSKKIKEQGEATITIPDKASIGKYSDTLTFSIEAKLK